MTPERQAELRKQIAWLGIAEAIAQPDGRSLGINDARIIKECLDAIKSLQDEVNRLKHIDLLQCCCGDCYPVGGSHP